MNVLISGLAQAIGPYLAAQATRDGLQVKALTGLDAIVEAPGATLIAGTIDEDDALRAATRDIDIVFHTALAVQGTPEALRRTNAGGTRRLLEACSGAIRRFVLISTPAVYTSHPTEASWPVLADAPREAHGAAAMIAYGQSMIEAEDLVMEASHRYGMEYCLLRTATVFGGNPMASHLVRSLMRNPASATQIDQRMGPLQWIHGSDAARAAVLAGQHAGARNQAFLVAAAHAFGCSDLLRETQDITHPGEPNPYEAQAHARRYARSKLDVSKIRERLGFEPSVTLRESLAEVLGHTDIAATPPAGDGAPMAGKTCVITGATSGVGLATAERLAALGARLVLVGRNPAKCAAALVDIRAAAPAADITMLLGDFSRLGDVRRIADEILAAAPRIDILYNNAGAMFSEHELTDDGFERSFVVNYLSHYLLTTLLLDRLRCSAPARIVTLTSIAHRAATLDFDDLQNARAPSGLAAYQRAKLACILFTRALASRLDGSGVVATALHPGAINSNFGDDVGGPMGEWLARTKESMGISVEAAAVGMAAMATAPRLENGGYYDQGRRGTPAPAAVDGGVAERLWGVSEGMIK